MNATRTMRMIVAVTILSGVLWSAVQAQSGARQSPGPPKTQEQQDKQKAEKRPGATKDPIHPDVRSKLEKSENGKVYVLVTLKPLPKEGLTKEQRKDLAKDKQDKLLSSLAEGEFTVDHRFETEPRMIGHVNAKGLDKLGRDKGVATVEPSKIEPLVFPGLAKSETEKIIVLVPLRPVGRSVSTQQERKRVVKEIQQKVLARMGEGNFEVEYQYVLIAALTGRVNVDGLEKLAVDDDVVAVGLPWEGSSQAVVSESPPTGNRTMTLGESIPFLGVDDVHNLGYTGADVTVAVIGSGIDCTWPDIQNQCVEPPAAFLGGNAHNDHSDVTGHATYMASIIVGVAPGAKILPVKIQNPNGGWAPRDLAKGVEHVVLVKDQFPNLRVINISQGSRPPNQYGGCSCDGADSATIIMERELVLAKEAEILIFSASGNYFGCGKMSAPACITHVEAVAAVYDGQYAGPITYGTMCTDLAGNPHQVVCASNRPPVNCQFELLGAPGYQITLPSGALPANYTGTTSGTSQATAHASGVAALMIERAGCPGPGTIAGVLRVTGTQAQHNDQCPGQNGVVSALPSSINALDAVNAITTACTLLGEPACTGYGPGLIDLIILINNCMQGPAVLFAPGLCTCLDFPSSPPDGDVDLHDFAAMQLAFSGTAQGACCDLNQGCADGLEEDCTGLYLGDFTKCAETQCPPIGACCQEDGSCSLMTCEACIGCGCPPNECPCTCTGGGGGYQGDGFDCIPNPCDQPDTGACCQQDGTCDDDILEADCLIANGFYQDNGSLCINVTCEQPQWPTGACCMMDGTCVDDQTEADCWATGWSYQGDGSTCATDACGPTGACCMGDGSCTEDLSIAECDTAGGAYEGDATVCSPNPCVQPAAACCDSSDNCLGDMTPADCTTAGGDYQGGGTTCRTYDCRTFGACCLPNEFCDDLSAPACAFQGGLYAGDATACLFTNCSVGDDGGTEFGACQTTEDKLLFDVNAKPDDEFGAAVAISGGLAVVGAPGVVFPAAGTGAAHLFRLGAANCDVEEFRLTGSDSNGGDHFGFAVALRGDTAVVGAPSTINQELNNTGSIYVFEEPLLGWQDMFEDAILNKSTVHYKNGFANTVAIREDEKVILVGSPGECLAGSDCDCDPNQGDFGCGAVFVFHKPLFGWEDKTEDLIITADDGEYEDYFGASVSISGTAALAGAPWEDEACGGGANCNAGAAYVFRSNATGYNWIEEAKLTASDAQDDDEFGTSVSIRGNVAIVGAPFDDEAAVSDVGSAYVFRFNPQSGQWNQEAKLTASDGTANDEFGFSVSVSGDLAVIGARLEDDTASNSGSMYVFRFDGFDWNEEAKLTASDASSDDKFGTSVSADGDRAVAGAISGEGGATNSGAAYVFEGLGDCNDSQTTDLCDIINDPSLDCCPPHDCCEISPDPECSDPIIYDCVCKIDKTCCTDDWHAACVALVEDAECGSCDPGGNGVIDTCEACPPDLDGDGEVGPMDLAMLLGVWGDCPNGCPEDLNGDCVVGAFDLAILLGCWGTCPCSAQAQWNGGRGELWGLRFALGGGGGCLPLDEAVQMLGYDSVGEFIEWVLSAVPPDTVYQVAQFLLWMLDHWPC